MGTVPALLTSRWASGNLVGDAAHSCMIRIRAGFINHFYETATMLDTTPGPAVESFPTIWQGHNDVPWQGQWTVTGSWITLTNVASANYVRSFDDKGGSTLTVLIDDIAFIQQTGTAGVYHDIKRGWYSPTRGIVVSSRPTLWAANEWADVLNGGYQVELWEGYGTGSDVEPVLSGGHWTAPAATKTFVGLIEGCDLDSHPDHVTLTCRDFSVLFTDQRLMGQNKATEIHSPVTFADRSTTLAQDPVRARGWVLVDDAADVVRELCLWAGFKEMDIQNFGWTLQHPLTFGQDAFFQDVLEEILAQGSMCWFIDAPTDHDMSIGVPVFRPQSATNPPPSPMVQILESQVLEALQVTMDLSNLPYVMRFRGAQSNTGSTLFEDTVKRWMGTYWPPWSGHDYTNLQGRDFTGSYPAGRVAGVRRQFSQTDDGLQSVAECLFACILAAIQYALQAWTATLQAPGYPGISLDQQISVVDEGTGTNTRIWVASIESTHTLGPAGSWKMSLGGSILDTEDMNLIAQDYQFTFERYVLDRQGA